MIRNASVLDGTGAPAFEADVAVRIRQIEAKALRKLKHPSRSRKLRSFLDT